MPNLTMSECQSVDQWLAEAIKATEDADTTEQALEVLRDEDRMAKECIRYLARVHDQERDASKIGLRQWLDNTYYDPDATLILAEDCEEAQELVRQDAADAAAQGRLGFRL